MGSHPTIDGSSSAISTPDLQLRVFVSSTSNELQPERQAAIRAVRSLPLTPVGLEPGAMPDRPDNYRDHIEDSDVFVGIYWQSHGWTGPQEEMSAIADEYARSSHLPRLIYVKEPAPDREPALAEMLAKIRRTDDLTYRTFTSVADLEALISDDLAVLLTERFHTRESSAGTSTLTFMFADLEGSTGMVQRLGSDYSALLSEYHRVVNGVVKSNGGEVVITEGDGFFCVFGSAIDAVVSAAEIQGAIPTAHWPVGEQPRCRIGVHTGTAVRTAEGYVGLDVHVAARIGAASQGGQILISSPVAGLVAEHAKANRWTVADLGQHELKGIGRSERLLRLDIPGAEIVSKAPRARPTTSSTVPAAPRAIIGRSSDVYAASEMLMRDSVRLVTLTGPGGTGKTRLAIELARALAAQFPDGIVFVDLVVVRDVDRFLPVVGRSFGVRESADRSILAGLEGVVDDDRLLLVLDNMEQLLAAAPHVSELIEALPNVKVLVTSRSPLRIGWENEYPVPPLDIPDETDDERATDRSGAVTLFVERAKAARPHFELNEVTRPVVAEITRRLDGLPLAIELAAARLRVFSVEELSKRLDDSLSLLDHGPTDAPERHRTLRGAIWWSYELLEPSERVLFRRLGVFSGGWTLRAAVSVCTDEEHDEAAVVDAMEELVAKSLVVFTIDELGRPRYRMLETLREFSVEQTRSHGEETDIHLRHLTWVREMAERVLEIQPTPEFPSFLDEVERERFNIRDALTWSARTGFGSEEAMQVCGMLTLFWDVRGFVAEGLRWARSLVAMTSAEGTSNARGMALTALGWLEMLADDPAESEWALDTAVGMFRDMGNDAWLGRALAMQGMTTYNRELLDEAEGQFNEAIVICQRNDLDWLADAWCTYGLAHVALARGDFAAAEKSLHHCLDYSRDHGLTWGVGHAQLSLGVLAFMTGESSQSVERLIESLAVRQQLRDARGLCDCLGMMALHASVRGDHDLTAVLIGAAEVAREASGDHLVPWQRPLIDQAILSATTALGDSYLERVADGRDLSMDEAISLIRENFAGPEPAVTAPAAV